MPKSLREIRALVVDDDLANAESFAVILKTFGCEVCFTTVPKQALVEAMTLRPRIAFLDLEMPELDGYMLAAMLRKQFDSEKLSLVAVSAYDDADHRVKSRRAGFDAHVKKPIDPDLVKSILQTVLRRE